MRPLAIHLVFQDIDGQATGAAQALAKALYERLTRGERPSGIPVRVWSGRETDGHFVAPGNPVLGNAEKNVVILLIDDRFFESRTGWRQYFDDLKRALRPSDLLLPVSICGHAERTSNTLGDINCIQVQNPHAVNDDERIFQAIFNAIHGQLTLRTAGTGGPDSSDVGTLLRSAPRVFLCHSKTDGEPLARELRTYIYEHTQLTCFFDTHNIPHGFPVKDSIKQYINESCVLVVWTDKMLDSRWCQFEILEARRLQRPLIVLDALSSFAPRISPFLSNMPVVRWSNNPTEVVSALLLELVRTQHLEALFQSLVDGKGLAPQFRLYPPDLMESERKGVTSTIDRTHEQLIVYPDPPLAAEELSFLSENHPLLSFQSLSEWSALSAQDPGLLGRKIKSRSMHPDLRLNVAISISETENWKNLGLIPEHQDDLATDLARQLILLGVRLLWGGDLRPQGIGARFESLVRAYHQSDHAPQDHIACYLAWPNYRDMSQDQLQSRRAIADILCLPQAGDTSDRSPAHDALCFSLMRQRMATDSDVRIILGGSTTRFRGRYAGIAEEAFESLKSGVPLYIIGGFGGAARALFDMIAEPNSKNELDAGWEMRRQDDVRRVQQDYDHLARGLGLSLRVDYAELRNSFTSLGMNGLCALNKLSFEENRSLALTTDIHEIASLVVRGLSRVTSGKSIATGIPALREN